MAIELNVAPGCRSSVLVWVAAPAGKTRSSALAAGPVGAEPSSQLPGLLHRLLPPAPLQVNVALGFSRDSRASSRSAGKGRSSDGLRAGQPVQRRPRAVFGMSALPRR